MLLAIAPTVEGGKILEYKGAVTDEIVIGTNVLKDFFAGIHDAIGDRSNAYEEVFREAKDTSLYEMQGRAETLDVNVIMGVDIDYETTGQFGSMLMVAVGGTAALV